MLIECSLAIELFRICIISDLISGSIHQWLSANKRENAYDYLLLRARVPIFYLTTYCRCKKNMLDFMDLFLFCEYQILITAGNPFFSLFYAQSHVRATLNNDSKTSAKPMKKT